MPLLAPVMSVKRQNFVNKSLRVWLLAVPIKAGLALPPGVDVKQATVPHEAEHVDSQTSHLLVPLAEDERSCYISADYRYCFDVRLVR